MWNPPPHDHEWINNERSWALVHSCGVKLAVCSVYILAEVLKTMTLANGMISFTHSRLQSELALLEGEGYKCIIIGDMNAHIGSPMESRFGISGNRDGINVNGLKFLLILSELMTWSSSIRRTSV